MFPDKRDRRSLHFTSVALSSLLISSLYLHLFSLFCLADLSLSRCVCLGREVGEQLIQDKRLSLVSFTGSTRVGKRIAEAVHGRY